MWKDWKESALVCERIRNILTAKTKECEQIRNESFLNCAQKNEHINEQNDIIENLMSKIDVNNKECEKNRNESALECKRIRHHLN